MNISTLKKVCLLMLLLFSLTTNQFYAQEVEPNNTVATGSPMPLNGSSSGNLSAIDGTDYHKVILDNNGTLTASADIAAGLSARIYIYSKNGSQLAIGNLVAGPGTSTVEESCLAQDDVYVLVLRSSGEGDYTLSNIFISPVLSEDSEPNNSRPESQVFMAPDDNVTGHLGYTGVGISDANDYYGLIAGDDGNIAITAQVDASLTARLYLYYKNGAQIGVSPAGSGELTATASCLANDTIYALVFLNAGCGSYDMTFTLDTPPNHDQDVESNNSIPEANVFLEPNESVQGRLGYVGVGISDAADYYGLMAGDDGNITVTAQIDETLTARLYLYYKNGAQIAVSTVGSGELSTTATCLANDTIYALVFHNSGCGSYDMTFTVDTPPNHDQDVESNNSIPEANVFLEPNESVQGRLGYVGVGISDTHDYFGLIAGDDGNVTITAQIDETLTARLYLYYKNGAQIAVSTAGSGELTTTATCIANDTIYALVFHNSGCGSYDMTFTHDPPTYENDVEPNGTTATANPMANGESVEGHLGYNGVGISDPGDYYSFEVVQADFELNAKITMSETLSGRIYLYNSVGSQLDVTPALSGTFELDYTITTAGTYYLLVFRNSGCGSYKLGDLCSSYPTVEATPPGPILKCPDEAIILSATPGLTTYAWYNGTDIVGNSQTYNAASSGDYSVIGYDINGCPDTSNVVLISALNCDDGNACTIDSCVDGECVYAPIDCDDGSACTTDSCDPATGCVYADVVCDDGNACTVDSCDPATGCVFTDLDCDDNDACTTDTCVDGTCLNTPVDCDDNDACTTDECVDGSCLNTLIDCDDANACTTDACDPVAGCFYAAVDCDDNDASTTDSCDPVLGCLNTPIACDDGDACTIDTSDPIDGCVNTPIDCDDNNACTVDSCDPVTGCVFTDVDCDDGSACTIDICDIATGCVYTDVDCDDGSACTTDICDIDTGCVYTDVDCDDGSACTIDICDIATGCVYIDVDCDDADPSTTDSCDPETGCVNTPIVAVENNALLCSDGLDNDGDDLIDCEDDDCQNLSNGCSTCFDDGTSFADAVLDYFNNCPSNVATNPEAALGVPDYGSTVHHVTLGNGGYVTLAFTNNTLTNSGDSGPDLWVFEVGPAVEASTIELRPLNAATETILINAGILDTDLDGFYEFGGIGGSTASVDIDAIVLGQVGNTLLFDAIKVVDVPGSCAGSTPGADIDAVCALSSLPCSIGETCDDGDPTTVNDVIQSDCTCAGMTVPGCMDQEACNYDSDATVDNESCVFASGCDECDGEGGVIDNPEIGDACDDGDDETINDIFINCDECLGFVPQCFDPAACNFSGGDAIDHPTTNKGGDDFCIYATGCDECDGQGGVIDNPEMGDECDDGDDTTIDDMVNDDCECVGESIFDCPDLQANIGDECDDGNDDLIPGIVSEDCECEMQELFDCPNLQLNIGDSCNDGNPNTINDSVSDNCVCVGEPTGDGPPNDNPTGAFLNTPDRLWGVPGWDSYNVGCATLSMQSCDGSQATSDSWYKFIAQAENQGILARANPSDGNAPNVDIVIQVFDANLDPISGLTDGTCAVDRSCFNNYGNGEIERAVPTGLTIGEIYFYRVFDANGEQDQNCSRFIDTKVKTFASHPVIDGCDEVVDGTNHTWTIENPQNLYNIPPVPVFDVRLAIKDANGELIALTDAKDPNAPGGLTFELADFPLLTPGDYTVHAQNKVKMMANGCVSAFWSQMGPDCNFTFGDLTETKVSGSGLFSTDILTFAAYPNPNNGEQVFIELIDFEDIDSDVIVTIVDMYGKQVHMEQFANSSNDSKRVITFDQNLSAGLYFINLTVNERVIAQKLIVQ